MKSRILTGPNDPTPMAPRWPGTNLPAAQPLPPGTTVATTATDVGNRWDTAKAIEYLSTVGKAYDQVQQQAGAIGVQVPQNLNIPAVVASITAGAGIGALFGGVGAPIGAVVGLLIGIYQMFAGQRTQSPYGNASVEAWATAYAPTAFVNWAIENNKAGWTTIPQIAMQILQWHLETAGLVFTGADRMTYYPGVPNHIFVGSAGNDGPVSDMYAQAGIDYFATKTARAAAAPAVSEVVIQWKAKINLPGQDNNGSGDGEGNGSGTAIALGIGVVAVGAYLASKS